MHGIITLTIKDWVITKYGDTVWQQIVAQAKCPAADFVSNQPYDDAIFFDLAKASCAVLKKKAEDLLEQIGYWFIVYTHTKTSYGKLLEMIGSDLGEALSQVNKLHAHLLKVAHFPTIASPTFKVTHRKGNSCRLHYAPGKESRVGLLPLVVGLVKGFGLEMLKLKEVKVTPLKTREADGADVLQVNWTVAQVIPNEAKRKSESSLDPETSLTRLPLQNGLTGKALGRLFPFHIMFDKECNIVQAGLALQKIVPMEAGDAMAQFFSIKEPDGAAFPNFKAIYNQRKHSPFTLAHPYDEETTLLLHGEMVWCKNKGLVFFACTPVLNSIEEARYLGIEISDFPLCDQAQARLMTAHAQTTKVAESSSPAGPADSQSADGTFITISEPQEKRQRAMSGGGKIFKSIFNPKKKDHLTVSDEERYRVRSGEALPGLSENGSPIQLDGSDKSIRTLKIHLNGDTTEAELRPRRVSRSGSYGGSTSPRGHAAPSQRELRELSVNGNATRPKRSSSSFSSSSSSSSSSAPSDRLLNAFIEMLLEDSWADFPLVRTLLHVDLTSQAARGNDNLLSEAVVSFYLMKGKAHHLLTTCFKDYIIASPQDEGAVLFREESVCVRLFRALLHLQASHYIDHCVSGLVHTVDALYKPLEIDPRSASSAEVAKNTKQLVSIAQEFVEHVCKSASKCPPSVRRILWMIDKEVSQKWPDMHLHAVSSLLFLRFLSPALVSPHRAKPASQRTLLLVAKLLNNLVNNVTFGEKESYMVPLNSFISPDNLALVQNFMKEMLSEEHIIAAAVTQATTAGEGGETQGQSNGIHLRGSGGSGIQSPPVAHNELGEQYRTMLALDEIKRALVQHMGSLHVAASASGSSKPKLQQALQKMACVFLCQLPTEMS